MGALFDEGVPQFYELRAPLEGPALYILSQLVSGDDTNAMDAIRCFTNAVYQVEVVGRNMPYDRVKSVADAVDDALAPQDDASIASPSFRIQDSVYVGRFLRSSVLSRAENYDNVWWYYLGGIYETIVYPLPGA